jgi:hypothetical protein
MDVVIIIVDTSDTHVVIDVRGQAPDQVSFATLRNWTPVLQNLQNWTAVLQNDSFAISRDGILQKQKQNSVLFLFLFLQND